MQFDLPTKTGKLIKRYKRFLADIDFGDGETVTVHCANPGAMTGLKEPGIEVLCSTSPNKTRKLPLSLELVKPSTDNWVGINTQNPNKIIAEALGDKKIAALANYENIRPETKYGENSRIDFFLSGDGLPDCYLEIKNVHFSRQKQLAEFPDSATARGAKHLRELMGVKAQGHRAICAFVIQRSDCEKFAFASDSDPTYFNTAKEALDCGVEFMAFACQIDKSMIKLGNQLKILDPRGGS